MYTYSVYSLYSVVGLIVCIRWCGYETDHAGLRLVVTLYTYHPTETRVSPSAMQEYM